MKVGDIIMETPTFYCKAGLEHVGPQECEVVYIHPKRRFYRVRFRSDATGETFTECKYFPERRGEASDCPPAKAVSKGRHHSAMPGTSLSDLRLH